MRRALASAHHRLGAQHSWQLLSLCVCTILTYLLPVTFTRSGSVPYFSNQHWLDQYLDILLSSAPTTRAGTSLIVTPSHLQNIWSINAYLWSFTQGPFWFEQMATWYRSSEVPCAPWARQEAPASLSKETCEHWSSMSVHHF